MSSFTGSPNTLHDTALEPLRAKSGWIIALGAVFVIAGIIALGSVVMAAAATVFVVGIMMVIAGVAEVINAFQIKTWGKFLLWLLLGALYIVAGFFAFENPLLAAAVLTLLLGFSLLVSGVMRIVLAFSLQETMPWIWVAFSGVITFLLGFSPIVAKCAGVEPYVLGVFLGVDLSNCRRRMDRRRARAKALRLRRSSRLVQRTIVRKRVVPWPAIASPKLLGW